MIIVVLGAPGSGKTTVIEPLAALLPRHVLLDWDAFMEPAAALAGRDIRANPETLARLPRVGAKGRDLSRFRAGCAPRRCYARRA